MSQVNNEPAATGDKVAVGPKRRGRPPSKQPEEPVASTVSIVTAAAKSPGAKSPSIVSSVKTPPAPAGDGPGTNTVDESATEAEFDIDALRQQIEGNVLPYYHHATKEQARGYNKEQFSQYVFYNFPVHREKIKFNHKDLLWGPSSVWNEQVRELMEDAMAREQIGSFKKTTNTTLEPKKKDVKGAGSKRTRDEDFEVEEVDDDEDDDVDVDKYIKDEKAGIEFAESDKLREHRNRMAENQSKMLTRNDGKFNSISNRAFASLLVENWRNITTSNIKDTLKTELDDQARIYRTFSEGSQQHNQATHTAFNKVINIADERYRSYNAMSEEKRKEFISSQEHIDTNVDIVAAFLRIRVFTKPHKTIAEDVMNKVFSNGYYKQNIREAASVDFWIKIFDTYLKEYKEQKTAKPHNKGWQDGDDDKKQAPKNGPPSKGFRDPTKRN